ncbi:MAG: hypothetical protein ACRCXC_13570 [Legionella sp.]
MGTRHAMFTQFNTQTANKLQSRWNQNVSFGGNESDFWRDSVIRDFKVTAADLMALGQADFEKLYAALYDIKMDMRGTLFPMHSKQFINNNGFNGPLLHLVNGYKDKFYSQLQQGNYSTEELKELQIFAAYLGHKDVVDRFCSNYGFIVDSEVLNLALLSGKMTAAELSDLTNACVPTYASIRYAVFAGQVDPLRQLIGQHHLRHTADHLAVAAGAGNADMFTFLINMGIEPEGDLIMAAAKAGNNAEIIDIVEHENSSVKHGLMPQ